MATLVGRSVGPTGFGLMGLTARSPQTPYEEAFKTMRAALAAGANLWNGGEFYGPPQSNSLHLLNAYFTKYPEDADKVVLSIKGGFVPGSFIPSGDKAGINRSVENCLKILDGKKKIDIFECGRVDPNVPIEETVRHLAEFVKAGKIGGIGLSETAAPTIRRAASVHPIVAVEVEYSIFATDIRHNEVASTCAELGIPIVAYSPLSRGLLTGKKMSPDELTEAEKNWPRFQGENFLKNLELVKAINKVAEEKGCTPAQFAIGWVKAQSGSAGFPTIIPIPGATTVSRVEENMKDVPVSSAEFNEINKIIATIPVQGGRYPKSLEHLCFG